MDGILRMCTDYHGINNNTVVNQYPLTRIDVILDCLGGSIVYRKLDLVTGYYQLAIEPIHNNRNAFYSRWGLYEYVALPFSLCNAPLTF